MASPPWRPTATIANGVPDDEDGVTFVSPILPGQAATVTVSASITGYLNAWIDFDGNGILTDASEQIAANMPLTPGLNTLTFSVPGAITDTLYSRFRFTVDSPEVLAPTGSWNNGEVEDYVTPLYALGNRVWFDTNNDGIDGNEVGVANVLVELLDANGAVILTDVTDNTGYYLFEGLLAGDYRVRIPATNFDQPGDVLYRYVSSTPDAILAGDLDDNGLGLLPDAATGITSGAITLGNAPGEPTGEGTGGVASFVRDSQSNLTVDFGFYTLSLGNRVWFDANNNGLDDSEPGAALVEVRLLDQDGNPVDNPFLAGQQPYTLTTDAQGYYTFTNLIQGAYLVEIVPPPGFTSSTGTDYSPVGPYEPAPGADAVVVDADDNGANTGAVIRTLPVTLTPGNEPVVDANTGATANFTVDFGLVASYSLGNRVWYDADNNGLISGSEVGIDGVVVELYHADANGAITGTVILTDVTAAGGYYRFDNLPPGDYIVVIPAGNFLTGGKLNTFVSSNVDAVNPNDDVDSDDNGPGVQPDPVTGVQSGVVTLGGELMEPVNEQDLGPGDQGAVDNHANMTVDFGFVGYDWGDLPDSPYPTLSANDGPRHVIDGTTFLGAGVDSETNGQPATQANGDDANGATPDDEDGVLFLTPLIPGRTATIQVTTRAADNEGFLSLLIDFNGDGDFLDTGEVVQTDQADANGIHPIQVSVPVSATGIMGVRVRFTDAAQQGGAAATGPAASGEVEDYLLASLGDYVWLDTNGNGDPRKWRAGPQRRDGTTAGRQWATTAGCEQQPDHNRDGQQSCDWRAGVV